MPERHKNDKSNKPLLSRLEKLQAIHGENYAPEMPPIDSSYLIEYLYEIGPAMADGPLTHGEIASWQNNTGITLSTSEARTIKRLSIVFVSESRKAEKIDCPAPWIEAEDVLEMPDHKTESMRDALRQLATL